jgi:flavin-dependent dehydrogenase
MLLEAARQSGAEVHLRRRVLRVKQQADGITIETDAGEVSACRVINASGRWSELRAERSLPDERWIGIKQHFVEAQPPASTDLYFFTGGYCGVQPVAADRVNVSALVRAQDARTLADMIVRSAALTRRSHAWTPVSETITTAPIVFGAPRPVSQGMANVGDAAAFIDPFLGDGIAIALQTGVLAARCLCHGSLERYRAEYLGAIEPALRRAAILRSLSRSSLAWTMMKVPGMVGITARATRARFPVSA